MFRKCFSLLQDIHQYHLDFLILVLCYFLSPLIYHFALGENIDKSKLLSLLAQLRKASNHPYLFEGVEKVAVDGLPTEEIVAGRFVCCCVLLLGHGYIDFCFGSM